MDMHGSADTRLERTTGEGAAPSWMWGLFGAAAIAFLAGLAFDNDAVRLVFKALPAVVLGVGVFLTEPRTVFRRIVAVGLAFGAAGDLLLEIGTFVPGLIAFLIGHVLYIVAFVRLTTKPALLVGVPYLLVGVALTLFVADGADDLLLPVIVYAIVISVMGWRTAALIGEVPTRVAAPLAIGAGLFIVSDALIAINRFHTEIPGDDWWIMLTYFSAQGLIALGAVRSQAR